MDIWVLRVLEKKHIHKFELELPKNSNFDLSFIDVHSFLKWALKKIQCTMKMVYFGKEIISTCGKVFSIDKTENIHVSTSGGLIYPKEIVEFFSDVQILIEINEND